MPTVTIRALPPAHRERMHACLGAVVHELAKALDSEPSSVWAHWVDMKAVQQGELARTWWDHCPVVTIRAREGRSEEQVARGLEVTARAVAAALGLSLEDIWVHWVELPPGRVFAGGALR